MHTLTANELTILLLAIGFMLLLARILSKIGQKIHIPTLVTEVLAGIILGPTLLGMFFPSMHGFLFPNIGNLPNAYDTIFNLAVVMLLFLAGMELDFTLLSKHKKTIILTSALSILIPFSFGFWFAIHYFDFLRGIEISAAPYIFPLTFGTIISISALPIISRILLEHKWINTFAGITIIGAAILADLIGWFGYSSILVYANAAVENIHILYTLLYITGFFIVVYFISGNKFIGNFFIRKTQQEGSSYDIASLFGICLLTAAFTNAIHIHSSLGAFIAGIVCRRILGSDSQLMKKLDLFIMNFFAPLFFISIGLNLNFVKNFNLWMVLVVFVIACVTKIIGTFMGARLGGLQTRPAWAAGFALNARGSMEIIMGALALKMGLIGPQLFVAIVIVSIVTIFFAEIALIRLMDKTQLGVVKDYKSC